MPIISSTRASIPLVSVRPAFGVRLRPQFSTLLSAQSMMAPLPELLPGRPIKLEPSCISRRSPWPEFDANPAASRFPHKRCHANQAPIAPFRRSERPRRLSVLGLPGSSEPPDPLGHRQNIEFTCTCQLEACLVKVRFGSLADILTRSRHALFTPKNGRWAAHPSQHLAVGL